MVDVVPAESIHSGIAGDKLNEREGYADGIETRTLIPKDLRDRDPAMLPDEHHSIDLGDETSRWLASSAIELDTRNPAGAVIELKETDKMHAACGVLWEESASC